MAPDSFDERRRKRELEDQREREAAELRSKAKAGPTAPRGPRFPGSKPEEDVTAGSMAELFDRIEPLIERLNSLYNQYILGVELRPPREVRSQLDQLAAKLRSLGKPTPAQQFRFSTLYNSYMTHCDRWDKMCRDLETGKIKRVAGPRKSR
jgi:hypothetical protein